MSDDTALIIGLSVGVGLLLIIIIIIIIVSMACRRNRGKPAAQQVSKDNAGTSTSLDEKDRPYSRRLPDDYRQTGMDRGDRRNKQLPNDYEETDIDKHYSRKLPDDYR